MTTSQVERTLRVFSTASTVDLSNNEIDRVPAALPPEVLVLDMSFNLIADAEGIERFQCLEELHLAFNRLADVSVLELCPRLLRVNLSGNRYVCVDCICWHSCNFADQVVNAQADEYERSRDTHLPEAAGHFRELGRTVRLQLVQCGFSVATLTFTC